MTLLAHTLPNSAKALTELYQRMQRPVNDQQNDEITANRKTDPDPADTTNKTVDKRSSEKTETAPAQAETLTNAPDTTVVLSSVSPSAIEDNNSDLDTGLSSTELSDKAQQAPTSLNPLLDRVTALYERMRDETLEDFPSLPAIETTDQPIMKRSTQLTQSSTSQFDLMLRTDEGDVITLSINQSAFGNAYQHFDGKKGVYSESNVLSTQSGYSFTVSGHLNAEEQEAIGLFLDDITQLTDAFLDYDLPSVMNAMQEITLSPSLSSFAVDMQTAFSETFKQKTIFEPRGHAYGHAPKSQTASLPSTPYGSSHDTKRPSLPGAESDAMAQYTQELLSTVSALMTEIEKASEKLNEKFGNQLLETLPGFLMDQWRHQENDDDSSRYGMKK